METFLQIAERNQKTAYKIIKDLKIESLYKDIGCEINLVGSLKSGLLMKHLDIDFHVYSDVVEIKESFLIILKIVKNPSVTKFTFKNLLNTDENCLEWHIFYKDKFDKIWQIDIIHMPEKSKYHGYFEHVTERISSILTDEMRYKILKLKYETPDDIKIAGTEYYRAVIESGISTYNDFMNWRKELPSIGIIEWCP